MSIQPQIFNQSAFGELMCAELTGVIQLQFPYNLNPELVLPLVTGSGTVTSSPPFALISVPASASSSGSFQSLTSLHYKPGQGALVIFTAVFNSGLANSKQYVGAGNTLNGFFFGWNGSTFGILFRNNSVDTWIYQVSWNQDPFNGTGTSGVTLDPTKGNVYKIQYQWLGFGNVNFFIENASTGQFTLVHQIQYCNLYVNTSLSNPNLPLFARAESTNAASLVQLKVPSMAGMIEGIIVDDNTRYAVQGNLGFAANTTTLVLTILNNLTYNNNPNPKLVQPNFISMASSGTSLTTFTYMLNPTVSATFRPANTSTGTSVTSAATGGNLITAGRTVLTQYIGANSYDNVFIDFLDLSLNPGDYFAVTALSATAATVSVSFSWVEQN